MLCYSNVADYSFGHYAEYLTFLFNIYHRMVIYFQSSKEKASVCTEVLSSFVICSVPRISAKVGTVVSASVFKAGMSQWTKHRMIHAGLTIPLTSAYPLRLFHWCDTTDLRGYTPDLQPKQQAEKQLQGPSAMTYYPESIRCHPPIEFLLVSTNA